MGVAVVKRNAVLALATGTPPAKRGRASYREFGQQKAFAERCALHPDVKGLLWTATMTGINLPIRVAQMAKAKGVRKGVPDFLFFERGLSEPLRVEGKEWSHARVECIGLALEFKDPDGGGRVKPEQAAWAKGLRERGWRVEFPETHFQAWAILADYRRLTR